MLPLILKRAMILAAVCLAAAGMAAFCAGILQNHDGEGYKLRVGYTAAENRITDLAVSYIQGMESVESLCSLEAVTEQEGRRLLKSGELAALIVLPDDVLHEILSGSNTPAALYLPRKRSGAVSGGGLRAVGGMLFEELASAGIGMLGTAQAEIYASGAILQELSAEYGAGPFADDILQSMYDDINRFNLEAVGGREKLFRKKTLSLTENDTFAVYYGSAVWTVYAMLAGLFFGSFCRRGSLQQTMLERRAGVGFALQLAARCLAGSMLMLAVLSLPLLLFLIPRVRQMLSVTVSPAGMLGFFFIVIFMTIYYMMIYQIVEKRESALVVTGVLAVLQAYLSGCLIPSVLLPGAAAFIGKFLPAAMVKKGFTILLTGDAQAFSHAAAGLCAWGLCLFLGTILSMRTGGRDRPDAGAGRASARIRVPSLGMVVFRRLLYRKSMWISLGMTAVLSAVITEIEQGSETQIRAAVYDASGDYAKLLAAYDGLVRFEQYGSDEAVRRAVQKGDAECGYVLPATLAEDMAALRADREIVLYQDADTVAAPVVNEILFERIFRQVSLKWFGEYISQHSEIKGLGIEDGRLRAIAEECFDRELTADTTFRFEIRRMDSGNASAEYTDENRTMYPVYAVAVTAVVLCTLQGILQVAADIKRQNFYKRNRLAVSAFTLILPVMAGVLCAFLIIIKHN